MKSRIWTLARLGCLIGEALIQEFGGGWFLNEIPDSRYFLYYVVGNFSGGVRNPAAMVAPLEVADYYLSQPPGRDLVRLVDELREELLAT